MFLAFLLLAPLAVLMEAAVGGKLGELRSVRTLNVGASIPTRSCTAMLISR